MHKSSAATAFWMHHDAVVWVQDELQAAAAERQDAGVYLAQCCCAFGTLRLQTIDHLSCSCYTSKTHVCR